MDLASNKQQWLISHKTQPTNHERLTRKRVLYAKGTVLKKINVSFIAHFYLGKYSFSLNIFWLIDWF